MTQATYRDYTGSAAELYQSFFVPAIATPVSAELLRTAGLQTGERVVDVACGTGVITRAAAEAVGSTGTVTGIDLAPDMIEVATNTPAAGAPIQWHETNAESLPLPDSSADVVLCQMGLMFMADRAQAVVEMYRVLVPGGRAVVNTPGRIHPVLEAMKQAIAENLNPDLGGFVAAVFAMPDPEEHAALLRDAGFDQVTSAEYIASLQLPGPAEFLWNYINLTPMGPLVAESPAEARDAMERQFVEECAPHVRDGSITIDQPVALASGHRG